MKKFLLLFLALTVFSADALAQASWRRNKLRVRKDQEALKEKLEEIPIYREKLDQPLEILGPVRGEDILSRKKDAIIYQMRVQADKMGADAIMEFKCESLKSIYQNCEGFAVKMK